MQQGVDLAGRPVYVHVAKHARRTVNPPPETWAAFSHEARGYKKTPHFALAVSRHGVHARLVLNGERLATTLWLADPQALARARAALAELGDLLRAQGVEVTRLDCLEGAPAAAPSATRLLEVRT